MTSSIQKSDNYPRNHTPTSRTLFPLAPRKVVMCLVRITQRRSHGGQCDVQEKVLEYQFTKIYTKPVTYFNKKTHTPKQRVPSEQNMYSE
jgi:hypothetical protein